MAKMKYSYSGGGSNFKSTNSQNRGKGKFFALLLVTLLLIVGAIYFSSKLFGKKEDNSANSAVTPAQNTEVKVSSQTTETTKKETTSVVQENVETSTPVTPSQDTSTTQNSEVPKEISQNPPGYDQDFAALQKAFAETDYQTSKKIALDMLQKYGEADKAGPMYRKLGQFITKLNMKIIKNGLNDEKLVNYRINFGDNLTNIAIKHNFPVEAIQKANNLKSTVIYPGKSLKVYTFDWRIEVSKKAKLLYVYDGDKLFALYDIGIGKEGRTPEGEFKITDKIANPDWYSPDGRIVAFGDKENVLGTRWLKLEPINDTDAFHIGYGIHGTWDTGSITKSLSNGCIRMKNEEVEELFTYIPRQVIVKIY